MYKPTKTKTKFNVSWNSLADFLPYKCWGLVTRSRSKSSSAMGTLR